MCVIKYFSVTIQMFYGDIQMFYGGPLIIAVTYSSKELPAVEISAQYFLRNFFEQTN